MSAIKYNLTFTGTAEVLFGILAKLVPSDDLHIHAEEVGAPEPHMGTRAEWLDHRIKEYTDPIIRHKLAKRKKYAKRRPSKLDLTAGINRIIMEALADGFGHRSGELEPLLKQGGFSPNSVGSRMQNLFNHGVVEPMGGGVWRLTSRYVTGGSDEQEVTHEGK